jgi:prepilin-type N-terminal cleavage/methylation domain-containing protein
MSIPLPASAARRRGMTLVEMLVAVAASLVLMAAIAQAFSAFGNAVSGSRAVLELDSRLRTVAWRLRSDLAGATARPLPPLNPAAGEGYLEIIEGPAGDYKDAAGNSTVNATVSGDHDDALLLTTRSIDAPFIGRAPGGGSTTLSTDDTFESTLAEVGWFARPTPGTTNPVTYTLYRRQLLVMGYVGTDPFLAGNNSLQWSTYGETWSGYFNAPCDVSVRREGDVLFPNTLADLTRREARFMHNPTGLTGTAAFPSLFAGGNHQGASAPAGLVFDTVQRQGEDVVLTNVLAFDVRVFEPGAQEKNFGVGDSLAPGDPGYVGAGSGGPAGVYADLGHEQSRFGNLLRNFSDFNSQTAKFAGFGEPLSRLAGSGSTNRVYDTWSLHYEADGLDQDGDGFVDEGTNGLDDDGDGLFDEAPFAGAVGTNTSVVGFTDTGEVETLPPYPFPLRGIEVRIRCYEPASRQVRQVTVRHTFVPH